MIDWDELERQANRLRWYVGQWAKYDQSGVIPEEYIRLHYNDVLEICRMKRDLSAKQSKAQEIDASWGKE